MARAEVREVEASLELSRANLGYATIKSPIDGVVVSRSVDVGQTVAASLSAPVLFTIAENLEKVHVLASVSEADIGRIRAGQPVRFSVDAFPESTFEGSVRQVRLSSTMNQNVVTYVVVVASSNPEGRLMPGMTANLRFETAKSDGEALRVPNAALRFEPPPDWELIGPAKEAEGGRRTRQVWIQEGNALKPIPVTTGLTDGKHTDITGGELTPGLKLVVGVADADDPSAELQNPFQFNRRGSGSGSRR